MTTLEKIQQLVQGALESSDLWSEVVAAGKENFQVTIEYPRDPEHGDYAANTAMQLAKPLGKNPREVAEILVAAIVNEEEKRGENEKLLASAPEVAGPGFINFRLNNGVLKNAISQANEEADRFGNSAHLDGRTIMVEYAHPNTHKAFHIGHLRNICLGESIIRFLESQGAQLIRANYQGDVGPHVAKCLWGMMNAPEGMHKITSAEEAVAFEKTELTTPQAKVEYLGKAYANGGKAYESDKEGDKGIQTEIRDINKKIYLKDPSVIPLWEATRQWSLDYFDYSYERLGSHFDRLYFESEMYTRGKEIVESHLKGAGGKDIFEESEGALVFKGEDHGLHTRVFVTREGNSTYEGKEMANVEMQYKEHPFDQIIHVVANEQAGYFQVVFKAAELVNTELVGKQYHLSYGMVNLSTGKMSSRTGDVVTADSLIDDAKARVKDVLKESGTELSEAEKEDIAEKVALGAVKFTMLHADSKRDIAFDMEQSLKLTGDSGPYLQYGYTRMASILRKTVNESADSSVDQDFSLFNELDWKLAKKLLRFQEEVTKSADELTTHNTAHYLVEVVSEFSRWYENNRVADAEPGLKAARLSLLSAIKHVLHNGLTLLGIQTVEKM